MISSLPNKLQKAYEIEQKNQQFQYPMLSLFHIDPDILESFELSDEIDIFPTVSNSLQNYKIILLGDGAVGKTTLRLKFMGKSMNQDYLATIGADFSVKKLSELDGKKIIVKNVQTHSNVLRHTNPVAENTLNIMIWDIAGQTQFRKIVKGFFQGSHGAVVVFDITQPKSFVSVPFWINHLWKITGPIPTVLLGNKIDKSKSYKFSSQKLFRNLINVFHRETNRLYGFSTNGFFTSALTGENVDYAFYWLIKAILANELDNINSFD